MIKSKGNNLGKVKDMDVINQAREKTKRENLLITTQNVKKS